MSRSRFLPWLLALLVLIGQQGGLLHHLGHDLDSARQVMVHDGAASPSTGTLPADGDEEHELCVLCVGFGAGLAAAGAIAGTFAAPEFSFARPLNAAPRPQPVCSAGAPIRGPPARFSALV